MTKREYDRVRKAISDCKYYGKWLDSKYGPLDMPRIRTIAKKIPEIYEGCKLAGPRGVLP